MKQVSYDIVTDKSIMEAKLYVLALAKGPLQQDIYDIVNSSIDIVSLRKKLSKRKDIALFIFSSIKKILDQVEVLKDFENHLIYLNLLLDTHFKPVLLYKYNVFQNIINTKNFTADTYCILRHLVKWHKKQLPDFLDYMMERLHIDEVQSHLLATSIYCIEKQYKQAYLHLRYIEFDNTLERYRKGLYHHSPYHYYKIIEHKEKKKLFPLFSK